MNLPEPARALGWHIARAVAVITATGVLVAYGALLILATGYAVAGNLPWWIPTLLLAGIAVPVGAATWWRAGRLRPGQVRVNVNRVSEMGAFDR